MFRIKICGITNVPDALAVVEAGADAIGLNFYEKSSRHISLDAARQVADAADIVRVGVVVNQRPGDMWNAWNAGGLSYIQIHGDETPEMLKGISEMDIITVRRLRGDETDVIDLLLRDMLHFVSVIGWAPQAMMIDAPAPGQFGGSGTTANWPQLAGHEQRLGQANLILAGGLTPENVAEAIRIVRPAAVDVCSGVESAPGKKDPHKVRDFVVAAREAFST